MAKKRPAAELEQKFIPGTEPKKIPGVHKAALAMLDAIGATKAIKADEDSAREKVREQMEKAGIDTYEYGGLTVKIDLKRTPKVKFAGERTEGEEE
jgi:hypothetical protein